jgi:hypothetical protein
MVRSTRLRPRYAPLSKQRWQGWSDLDGITARMLRRRR